MDNIVVYIENEKIDEVMNALNVIPCFLKTEYVEMNYTELEIGCRIEDTSTVVRILSPYV